MTALFITLAMTAYTVANLYAARWLYGHWRAREMDRLIKHVRTIYDRRNPEEQLAEARDRYKTDRPFHMLGALAAATVWPVTLLGLAVARFMDTTPVRSRAELEADRVRMAARIAELEKQLGISDRNPA